MCGNEMESRVVDKLSKFRTCRRLFKHASFYKRETNVEFFVWLLARYQLLHDILSTTQVVQENTELSGC